MRTFGQPPNSASDRPVHDERKPSWTSRRGPSGSSWSRLRPAPILKEPLAEFGFVSKGETRLLNFKNQESYFRTIFERYMQFCHTSRADLAHEFEKLALTTTPAPSRIAIAAAAHHASSSTSSSRAPSSTQDRPTIASDAATTEPPAPPPSSTPSPELTLIQTAMRKLREAILASQRTDDFARTTYLFIARASILFRSWEAYVPALTHLITHHHPSLQTVNSPQTNSPLSSSELQSISTYQILDLACRQRDLMGAYTLRAERRLKNEHVDAVLRALVRDEWGAFWKAGERVDGYVRAVMAWAEEGVRVHALKCVARTYFVVEREYVEKCAGRSWEALVEEGVGWELETVGGKEMVVVRRAKAK
ncbi:hypothetical protein BT63DRAFT_159025 [Microthyrium microscopicum]|uniref:CSN8/PSMD8/EIF3K domain-containing protein n=1 Tax=Microthyrium microscopicum TaxID=703497 RepID=A0A6A6UMM2_9PEZI|nr:hypothetical protein BT63DRAFT_159025 [Microthyrium microscopicum]